MQTLSIDAETYSPVNLTKAGVYPYAAHPDFQLLLFGYRSTTAPPSSSTSPTASNCPMRYSPHSSTRP